MSDGDSYTNLGRNKSNLEFTDINIPGDHVINDHDDALCDDGGIIIPTIKIRKQNDAVSPIQRNTSKDSIYTMSSDGSSATLGSKMMNRLAKRVTNHDDDDAQSVGKGWRNLRNAVKVSSVVAMKKRSVVTREDSFLKKFSTRQPYRGDSDTNLNNKRTESHEEEAETVYAEYVPNHPFVVRLDGSFMWHWLGIVTIAVLYNLWTCIAREAFREIQRDHNTMWIVMDACCDLIYVLDIVCQLRTGYLDQGIMVFDSKKLAMKYIKSKHFALDLLTLLPLDILQIFIGMHPMLRFPRFIKVYRSFRFIYMMESRTQFPNFFRVANLTHILFLGSHWFAAFYYLISEAEDFEGSWSYPKPEGEFSDVTRKYLASLFWSTLTLTTIGDLPPPETNWE